MLLASTYLSKIVIGYGSCYGPLASLSTCTGRDDRNEYKTVLITSLDVCCDMVFVIWFGGLTSDIFYW